MADTLFFQCGFFLLSCSVSSFINMNSISFIQQNWGKVPFCNRRPERAPHLGSFVFPICWRCTGLLIGLAVALTIRVVLSLPHYWLISLVCCLPLGIDWCLQRLDICESTNTRRFLTGFLLALGQVVM